MLREQCRRRWEEEEEDVRCEGKELSQSCWVREVWRDSDHGGDAGQSSLIGPPLTAPIEGR